MSDSNTTALLYDVAYIAKMKVLDATDRLMQKTPLDKLTVKDICAAAGVSRPTFYRYFKDKYDIAQWYWTFLAENCLKGTGTTITWYESNLNMLREFQARYDFFLHSFQSETYNSCREHGYRCRVDYLRETITTSLGIELTEELDFQIRFFVDAESRAVVNWLKEGMPNPPETIARYIESCVPRRLYELLDATVRSEQKKAAELPLIPFAN